MMRRLLWWIVLVAPVLGFRPRTPTQSIRGCDHFSWNYHNLPFPKVNKVDYSKSKLFLRLQSGEPTQVDGVVCESGRFLPFLYANIESKGISSHYNHSPVTMYGEDAAYFSLAQQKVGAWAQFGVAVSSVMGFLYYIWLYPGGPSLGDAYKTKMESLAKGDSTTTIVLMLTFFSICHSGLANLRPAAEAVVGPRVWRYIFALVSLPLAFSSMVYFMNHRNDGVEWWDNKDVPGVRPLVFLLSLISFLFLYPSSFNLLEIAAVDKPELHLWETGISRITRHPQFTGQLIWCAAHLLYTGTSFMFATYAVLCGHHLFAVWNGDRRLKNKFGAKADRFFAETSVIPFAAILSGKQQLPENYIQEFLRVPYLFIVISIFGAYLSHKNMIDGAASIPW